MRRKLFLLIIFTLFSIGGYCQQFYVATSSGTLELVTLTAAGPQSQAVPGCGTYNYFSIAISGNKIFYNTPSGSLYSGDITGGSTPAVSNCTLISTSVFGNSLTIDSHGIVYYAGGNNLYSIDPKNPLPVSLGTMPYGSAGDLAFYNGQLYMAAPEGIVKIMLSDPSKSTLYIPIPGQIIYSLTTFALNGKATMYALTLGNDYNSTNMLELDMQKGTLKGNVGTLPYVAYDAGSSEESGSIPVIQVTGMVTTQECDVYNKGRVDIACAPHISQYTFSLNTGQTSTTGTFDNLPPGNYNVKITSTGGELPATTTFTVPDYSIGNPVITATTKNPVCDVKGEIKLDAGTVNTSYSVKYGNNIFGFDHLFTGLDAGSYHFTILNQKGCVAEEKDYMLQLDACPPITILGADVEPECDIYGEAVIKVTTKAHPDPYTYTLNNVSDTTGVFDFLKPGKYDLVITSSGGDKATQQVIVPDYTLNKPDIKYVVKSAVCALQGEITFAVSGDNMSGAKIKHGGSLYSFEQIITGLYPGLNYFSILNQQGCIIDTLSINITQDKCIPIIFPNTFTPNGDGINDTFRANQDSNPANFKLLIYNRWGMLIFQSQSVLTGWDGNYNGTPAPVGVYYYIATFAMPGSEKATKSGFVTLIR